jgi:hypothetical protein
LAKISLNNLTKLSVAQIAWRRIGRQLVSNEFEKKKKMWKEAATTYFETLARNFREGTEEGSENRH